MRKKRRHYTITDLLYGCVCMYGMYSTGTACVHSVYVCVLDIYPHLQYMVYIIIPCICASINLTYIHIQYIYSPHIMMYGDAPKVYKYWERTFQLSSTNYKGTPQKSTVYVLIAFTEN